MRGNFEDSYKKELDRVRLTEESKKALTERLSQYRTEEAPRRRPLGARHMAAVAAAVCLLAALAIPAVATAIGDPTLGSVFSGDQAGYDQSSGVVGRSVERDGWTVSITDCVGDDYQAFLGVEVTAPEGTVLDADYYEIYVDNEYDRFISSAKGHLYSLPDDDPTDNRIRMIYDWYDTAGGINGVQMRLRLVDLWENHGYLYDEHRWDDRMVKEGEWDFGWIPIKFEDNAIRLSPMVEIPDTGLDGSLVLSEIVISPVGLYVAFDGPEPYLAAWVDDWYMANVHDTIRLYDVDGNEIPLREAQFYGPGGTRFGFTDTTNAMNTSTSEKAAELNLVDLERVGWVSVAGFDIPAR